MQFVSSPSSYSETPVLRYPPVVEVVKKTFRIISKSARTLQRDPASALLFVRMASWIGWLSLAVKFMPLPRALNTLTTGAVNEGSKSPVEAAKLAATIDRILQLDWLCFEPICWKRAAVLHRYLALNGIESRVVFGMRKDEQGQLHGHAWLEADGSPILESEPPNYTVTYSFPSTARFDLELELLNQ